MQELPENPHLLCGMLLGLIYLFNGMFHAGSLVDDSGVISMVRWINDLFEKLVSLFLGEAPSHPTPVENNQPAAVASQSAPVASASTPQNPSLSGIPRTSPPQPYKNNSAPSSPGFLNSPFSDPSKQQVAGMKVRQKGEKEVDGKIVQAQTNDTMYLQRNEIVKVVYDRYAKFGDTIASAILSKTFLPNGQQLMLARLGLQSVGSAMPDHDQIVDWIDEQGVDAFCEKMSIRKPGDSPNAEAKNIASRAREARTDQKASITEGGIVPVSLNRKKSNEETL
jgi:hypothetical protein